jgi:hypothetical protein
MRGAKLLSLLCLASSLVAVDRTGEASSIGNDDLLPVLVVSGLATVTLGTASVFFNAAALHRRSRTGHGWVILGFSCASITGAVSMANLLDPAPGEEAGYIIVAAASAIALGFAAGASLMHLQDGAPTLSLSAPRDVAGRLAIGPSFHGRF